MIVIPAIDIIDKKVVRLTQGDFNRETIYSDNPVEIAIKWQEQGAQLLHVVDLDGARSGECINLDMAGRISKAVDIPVQFGGGLRTKDDVERALEEGISKVIIGTRAAIDIEFTKDLLTSYDEKIIVSIDAVGISVMASGWGEEIQKTAIDLACEISGIGVSTIIFSNIKYDGTLEGIKEYWVKDMIDSAGNAKVIIAGGVSSLSDIIKLKDIAKEKKNLYGVITGKAIYEGKLNLADAIKAAKEN
jgi:phosphoribosylformimino-5-aminoimidazole carboxamide ribotide isomerase